MRELNMQEIKSVSGGRKPTSTSEAMNPTQGVSATDLVTTINTASGAGTLLTTGTPAMGPMAGIYTASSIALNYMD